MVVNILVLGIGLLGAGLIIATPWMFVLESIREYRSGQMDINPVVVMVCAILCLFELASAVDWLTGHPSLIF